MREGAPLLLGLPLALWGLLLHALPYRLTALAVRALDPERDVTATYKLGAALLAYPLGWAAEAWLAWRLGGGWLLALLLVSLVPAGFFALAWQARLARVRRDARGFLHFLVDRDLHRRLAARRRALVDEMRALAQQLPGGVPPR
jgi:hypothetical protein